MSRWSFRIATVWGIPIRLHVTALLLIPFLYRNFGIANATALAAGIVATITLHELGHSYVALRKNCLVREILILPIGGVAQMESVPRQPLGEFLMAAAGPAVCLALSGILISVGRYLPMNRFAFISGQTIVLINIAELLGWINLGIVLFNLIPAFPMDGGRMLRAALSTRLGRLGATIAAAAIGRTISLLFIPLAFFLRTWSLLIIGPFIFMAARRELQHVIIQEQQAAFWSALEQSRDRPPAADTPLDAIIEPPPYGQSEQQHSPVRHSG